MGDSDSQEDIFFTIYKNRYSGNRIDFENQDILGGRDLAGSMGLCVKSQIRIKKTLMPGIGVIYKAEDISPVI
jgi:hypothetical protein